MEHDDPALALREPNSDIFLRDLNGFIGRMTRRQREARTTWKRANRWSTGLAITAASLAFCAAVVSGLVAIDGAQGLLDSSVLATLLSAAAGLAATIPATGKLSERARFYFSTEQVSRGCGSRAQTLRSRVQDRTMDLHQAWEEFQAVQTDSQEDLPELP